LELTIADMVDRYSRGESLGAIAKAAGTTSPTVRRRLIDADVEIREPGRHAVQPHQGRR
jgi:hypothetical protein